MLNELYVLGETLEKMEIFPYQWHKEFKALKKVGKNSPAFRVAIGNGESLISSVEIITQEKVSGLRKWEPSNGLSFPCFNLRPVLANKKEIFGLLDVSNVTQDAIINLRVLDDVEQEKRTKDVNNILDWAVVKLPSRLLTKIGEPPAALSALSTLVHRLEGVTPDMFIAALMHHICSAAGYNFDNIQTFSPLIYSDSASMSSLIVLDIDDYDKDTGYPVAHEKTHRWINDSLIKSFVEGENNSACEDAFGAPSDGSKSKLDDVTLPILGKVHLRSMVKEAACQYRYRRADYDSFCIGINNRKKVKGSLEWLASPDFRGKTWDGVGQGEVLFAYPSELPKNKIPSYMKLVQRVSNSPMDEKMFTALAKDVITSLKGTNKPLSQIEIRLFALRKMDTARTKVVYNVTFSAEMLRDKVAQWTEACKNIPQVYIAEWTEEKGKKFFLTGCVPVPLEINDILNRHWSMDGISSIPVDGVDITTGISLFLDRLDIPTLLHFMHIAIENGKGLAIATAHSSHKKEVLGKAGKMAKLKILCPVVIGLLLYKQGVKKEDYMKSQVYTLGRMLALADDLHYKYCEYVRTSEDDRKGNKLNIPPQLLGNSIMNSALESPVKAFGVLSQRLLPYLSWARTNQTDVAKLTRWMVNQYRGLESEFHISENNFEIQRRMSDNDKGVLLLGYLAGVRGNKERNKNMESDENNDEGETVNG